MLSKYFLCTQFDLKLALRHGIYMNLDNENEIAMVDELIKTDEFKDTKSKIGLRVNPVVGGGSIAIMSTATAQSKFGLPITVDTKDRVVDLYKKHEWLTGIHIHIGSQGVALDLFVRGSRVKYFRAPFLFLLPSQFFSRSGYDGYCQRD